MLSLGFPPLEVLALGKVRHDCIQSVLLTFLKSYYLHLDLECQIQSNLAQFFWGIYRVYSLALVVALFASQANFRIE